MMRGWLWIGVVGVLAGGAAACGGARRVGAPAAEPVRAQLARAEAATVPQTIELYGTVEAERTAAVSSRVMAAVRAVRVKPGDVVKAGQVLVEIDPQTAEGQVAQARGALAQAQAAFTLAHRNLERYSALVAKAAASELELDMARMQDEQAQGAVEQAKGALEAATSVAKESVVVAPFAGRVAAKMVEVGDLTAPGRPLVVVESEGGRRLAVAAPESAVKASNLELGSRVSVSLDVAATTGFSTGTVVEITPGPDPVAHTFLVKIALPGQAPVGAAGRARLEVGSRTAVLVPETAVIGRGGLKLVVVRDAGGRARSRVVTLGDVQANGRVEVLSGVAAGDEVLVGLATAPADGTPVEAAAESAERGHHADTVTSARLAARAGGPALSAMEVLA
jgi:multidrug efflux system membrane fusion protein